MHANSSSNGSQVEDGIVILQVPQKLSKKVWHDPVWSKVIANGIWGVLKYITIGILLIIGLIVGYFSGLWLSIFYWVISETIVPNWILVVLCMLSLFSLIQTVGIIHSYIIPPKKSLPPKKTLPSWITYTSDLFFNVRWDWEYIRNGELDISSIIPYCPKCGYLLFLDFYYDIIRVDCENCGQENRIHMSRRDLESRVVRNILHKIDTGTWGDQNSSE